MFFLDGEKHRKHSSVFQQTEGVHRLLGQAQLQPRRAEAEEVHG